MEWYQWAVAGIGALAALGAVVKPPSKHSEIESAPIKPTSYVDQTRRIIRESLKMAATTKRRDTAANRLNDVHLLLDELHSHGSTNTDDMSSRSTANQLQIGLAVRFPKKAVSTKPRGPTTKTAFMQRWRTCKEAVETHPYALWVTVMDNRSTQACRELHGRAWRVDGVGFADLVHNHFAQKQKDCRCRMRPMTLRAINEEQVQRMD